MKRLITPLVAALAALNLAANETWTIDVSATEGTKTITEALGAGTNIVKKGAGKLIIVENAGSAAFNGTVTIEEGELEAQSSTQVGGRGLATGIPVLGNKPANTIIIKKGARFIGTFAKPGGNDQCRPILTNNIELEGDGPDGKGALFANSPSVNSDHYFAGSITLKGDARVSRPKSGGRWGINGVGQQTVSLNGHTLTIASNSFVFDGMKYDAGDGGRVVFTNDTYASTEIYFLYMWLGTSTFVGNGTLVLDKGTQIRGWGGSEAPTEIPMKLNWKTKLASGCSILIGKGWMTFDGDMELGNQNGGTTTIGKYGNGRENLRTTFRGTLTGVGKVIKSSDSTMVMTGAHNHAIGQLDVSAGTLLLQDAGLLMVTNKGQCVIDGNLTAQGKSGVTFGPKGVSTWTGQSASIAPAPFYVRYGSVDLDGGVVTARVNSAINAADHADFYLRSGGELAVWGGPANDGQFAQNGSAYIGQEGGRLVIKSCASLVGRYSTSGRAVYEMKGGAFTLTPDGGSSVSLMRGSTNAVTVMRVSGGEVDWRNKAGLAEFKVMSGDFGNWGRNGGRAVVTLDGETVSLKAASVNMSHKKNDATATLNLNAGTLEAARIEHRYEDDKDGGHAATRTFVNFGGGTFKLNAASTDIFGAKATGSEPVSRVTVYAGGATIDTAGFDAQVKSVPFSAPQGQGVAAIALPSEEKCLGYSGAPLVTITGDGEDATAFCAFDRATGKIGPITVTSPGRNYTTASASIIWTNRTTKIDLAVTLAPQVSGGLTKRGAGTLTLATANGYAGKTAVEGGTLALAAEGAAPAGTILEISAVTLAAREKGDPAVRSSVALPFAEIHITGAETLDAKTFGTMKTLVELASAPAQWPAVKLIASDGTALSNGNFWSTPSRDGTRLLFGPAKGLHLIIK